MEEIVLETERLYLRKFIPEEDAAFFVELVNSPKWLRFIGDRNIHTEEAAIKSLTERALKSYEEHGYGGYVIIEKTSGQKVGNAGLYRRPIFEHADVGYALLPQFEGKGYAFEAAQGVVQFARGLKMKHIYGITVAYHTRSVHLLEKLGLKFERVFRMEGDPEELSLYGMPLENG